MPVLHRYTSRPGQFVKARVGNEIATFQLSREGAERLATLGVAEGVPFPLGVLLPLIKSGDAFTGRARTGAAEVDEPDPNQTEFAFRDDNAVFEKLPKCEETGSAIDIHLVVLAEEGGGHEARLLGPDLRHILRKRTEVSVPVDLLDLARLRRVCERFGLPADGGAVAALKRWFRSDLEAYWQKYARARTAMQQGFDLGAEGELEL